MMSITATPTVKIKLQYRQSADSPLVDVDEIEMRIPTEDE